MSKLSSSGWRFRRFGPISSVLKMETFDLAPQQGEAVVQMLMAPLHRSDAAVTNGTAILRQRASKMPFPRIGGCEGVGRVEHVGVGSKVKEGDLVWVPPMHGTWATKVAVSGDVLHRIDSKHISLASLASLFLMANHFLHEYRSFRQGDVLLQNGGSSLTSLAVSALATKVPGLTVYTAALPGDRFSEAVQRHKKYGSEVFEYTPAGRKALSLCMGSNKAALFLNGVGGSEFDDFLKLMKPGADVVCYGAQHGPGLLVSGSNLIYPEVTLSGFYFPKFFTSLTYEDRQAKLDGVLHTLSGLEFSYPISTVNSLESIPKVWDSTFLKGGCKGMVSISD